MNRSPKTRRPDRPRSRGFCHAELGAVVLVFGTLAALLAPLLAETRAAARADNRLRDLKQIGLGSEQYVAAFDLMPTFSWKKTTGGGMLPSEYPDLQFAETDVDAAANQAIDILRRAGREDIPRIPSWIPHVQYNLLPLQDFLGTSLPDPVAVSASDTHRANWQIDPQNNFDEGVWLPYQPWPSDFDRRWPYSSSYEPTVSLYDRASYQYYRVAQYGAQHYFFTSGVNADLGPARPTSVTFPSVKAHYFGRQDMPVPGRPRYFADELAVPPILFFDGSVSLVATSSIDEGWLPHDPASLQPTTFTYQPFAWDAQLGAGTVMKGYMRFTRDGLAGRDITR